MVGRFGEVVVVVVRWPAEPMQQEVKGCGSQCSGREGTKADIRSVETKSTRFHLRLSYLT